MKDTYTQVYLADNIKFTCRVLDALVEANGNDYQYEKYYRGFKLQDGYRCNGHDFKNIKQFCLYILEQVNEWRIACNVCDLDVLRNATMSGCKIPLFKVVELPKKS